MNTRNLIFAFLGGSAVGAVVTVGVMRRLARRDPERFKSAMGGDKGEENKEEKDISDSSKPLPDNPSFDVKKKVDTSKTSYHIPTAKPSLEDLAKKYEGATVVKEAAEREHPEDDEIDEDLEEEITEAQMHQIGIEDIFDTDGFGHAIRRIESTRRDQEILLVSEEYAGEMFPLEDLTYYVGDDILCDVTDAPIDDVQGLIGDALSWFGEGSTDPDKVFIRNCSRGFEYEITRNTGYFGARVYGISDEDMAALKDKPKRKGKDEK